MNPVTVIGDAHTVLAFALGGVSGTVADSVEEVRAAVAGAVAACRGGGGPVRAPALLLVTTAAASLMRDELRGVMLDPMAPIVLEIPAFGGTGGETGAERFVDRMLGMRG